MWRYLRRRDESAFDRKPKPRGSREAQEPSAKDYSPGLEYRRKRCVLKQEAQRSHDERLCSWLHGLGCWQRICPNAVIRENRFVRF